VVFTGDTGPSDAIAELAQGADILVSEVIDVDQTMKHQVELYGESTPEQMQSTIAHLREEHLTPEDLGKMAERAKVKMVVLSHIVMGFDEETDFLHYVNGVRRHFSGVVVAGQDLDQF
jgi:ribonuclease BN (tRNA processing enzyme)